MAASFQTVAELVSNWPSGDALLAAFLHDHPGCLLAPVEGGAFPAKPGVGDPVMLRLRLADRGVEVRTPCKVIERRAGKGWVLELAVGHGARTELLFSLARGQSVPWSRRRGERYPLDLSLTVRTNDGSKLSGQAITVSDGGLGLMTALAVPLGVEVRIGMWPLAYRWMWPLSLRGRVVACEPAEGRFALGVSLRFISQRQSIAWKKLVAAAAAKAT